MRILYSVTGATFGGAPQHVLHLTQFMLEHGHQVGVMAAPERRLMNEADALGIDFFPNRQFVSSLSPHHDLLGIAPTVQAIRRFRPDLIHCHSIRAGLISRVAAALTRTPAVYTVHGTAFAERRVWWTPGAFRWAERCAARVTQKIICVSEFDRKLSLEARVGRSSQYVVIHNGVPESRRNGSNYAMADADEARELPTLITVARLSPPKDFHTLLEAVRLLPHARLLIVGEGPLRNEIESEAYQLGIDDRVEMLGERHDIPYLLERADIFVLSSKKEGLSLSVMEAMMAGLPVVASNVGGMPELVKDGSTGFLVPASDPKVMARSLADLIANPGLRGKLGHSGRMRAREQFGLARMGSETLSLYEDVLSG